MFFQVEKYFFFQLAFWMDGKCLDVGTSGLDWKTPELCRSSSPAWMCFSSWMGRALPAFPGHFRWIWRILENSLQGLHPAVPRAARPFPVFQLEVFPLLHGSQAGLGGKDFEIHQIPAPQRLLQAPSWDTSMDRPGFLFSWRNPLPILGWLVKGVKITFRS